MKKKWTLHIIAGSALVVFIALGLGSGTTESAVQNKPVAVSVTYTEIPFSDLKQSIKNITSPGHGFIVEAYITELDPQYVRLNNSPLKSFYSNFDPLPEGSISIKKNFEWFDNNSGTGDISLHLNDGTPMYDRNTIYKVYIGVYYDSWYGYNASVDKIEGLFTREQAIALHNQKIAEDKASSEAQQKAEQERLANLYRQAGNNFGNLRNTTKTYGTAFGRDYYTTIYNFGNGNYSREFKNLYGDLNSTKTGTYRVNGTTVIFLSGGTYSFGTIVGTALNIDGDIYR